MPNARPGRVCRPKDDVGAERHGAPAEDQLSGPEVEGRREPPLLVVLLVAGDRGLRDERPHVAAGNDSRDVVEGAVEGDGEPDDQHGAEAGGGLREGQQGVGGAVEQQVLVEQVPGGVASQAHFREDRQLRPLVVCAPGEGQHLLEVGGDVRHLDGRDGGRHAHEPEVGGGGGLRRRGGLKRRGGLRHRTGLSYAGQRWSRASAVEQGLSPAVCRASAGRPFRVAGTPRRGSPPRPPSARPLPPSPPHGPGGSRGRSPSALLSRA